MQENKVSSAVAVIGMACRYPGANDLRTFWENILTKRRQFRPFPDQRFPLSDYYDPDPSAPDKTYCSKAALIDGFVFDWIHHRIPKSSFLSSDIVHWLALDVALQALTDAGLSSTTVPHERSGVILGNSLTGEQTRSEGLRLRWPFVNRSLKAAARAKGLSEQKTSELSLTMESYYKSVFAPVTEDTLAGSLSNTIAGRICNYLDLHGGGYTVDGACSSGLIAIATAASALTNRDIDLALAGGVDVSLDTLELIGFAKVGALTKSDMHVYDRRGSGFIPGEGCGFVALKRLEDAVKDKDYIYAVIRGWGLSSDGKGGLTAPSVKGQSIALRRAYDRAGFNPLELDFIEGHGTGTTVGDKVELEAVSSVLGDNGEGKERVCGMTSLKSIIGHTKAASGIGGFIKAAIAVNQRILPPTANCTEPNEIFDSTARSLYPVITGEIRVATEKLNAGISAMGFGGINCHVTIESADAPSPKFTPSMEERKLLASHQDTELFVFSSRSSADLVERVKTVRHRAQGISEGELIDLAAQLCRELDPAAPRRASCIAGTPEKLSDCLRNLENALVNTSSKDGETFSGPDQNIFLGNNVQQCRIGFLFPGQGSQQINMARTIVERHGWAQDLIAKADEWCGNYQGGKLTNFIYRTLDRAVDRKQVDAWSAPLRETKIAQPAICLGSLLWAERLKRLGIRPVAVGGHSLGELTAFHVAGAFDEETLLKLAKLRGKVMGAPADESGIMASLSCSYDTVMGILNQVTGYAVVANINSPEQIVISGERSSIEKAVSIASDKCIGTHILPVSNAFHSEFVLEAAEHLRISMEIPEVFSNTTMKLFTCVAGKPVEPGLKLRDHFVNQAISQVDFISMVKALSRECDLLLEVGPGSVLSKLSNAITNRTGPRCLPVESKAGKDHDMNRLLGEYFVRGGSVNWEELYEGRLVRHFIPASERIFIENPCERPFVQEREVLTHAHHQGCNHLDSNAGRALVDTKNLFSNQEIDVIRQLIRSELQGTPIQSANTLTSVARSSPPVTQGKSSSPDSRIDRSPDILIELASEISGFPRDSISLSHRLLDDLNLDSIKAGQFVAKALKRYGVTGTIDPTTMAKSSLQEIYARIENHIQSVQHVNKSPDEKLPGQPTGATPTPEVSDNWVRNFKIAYTEQQRTPAHSFEGLIAAASKENKRVLIISDDGAEDFCAEMLDLLTRQGVSALSADYRSLFNKTLADDAQYDYFIFLLPRKKSTGLPSNKLVLDMVARIHSIGTIITSLKSITPKPTYAIVQFGIGDFHKSDGELTLESKGSTAFLCSLHLENPAERIRILEFSNKNEATSILQRIMEELRAVEEFSMAAFDSQFVRYVPVFDLAEASEFKDRKITWTQGDVVLVTGGARGITAECALAFAKKTGVKLALVGSTVLIDKDNEIQQVLQRYRENKIAYRYYACDISDTACVFDLRKRIELDLGVITGVIHGAAINRPRLAEQVTLDEAVGEIAPKLLGALNICEILKDSPPKLFVGFSSIIGITGMMGNAWYGFSNECLNLLLQHFELYTGTTEVISLAFSIWGEIGMGRRMGSLAVLSSMGIHSIPRDKGVASFMRLIEQDAGEKHIVVASRLGGLSTLKRRPQSKPRNARFLEEVLFYEQGVEIETKALLTLDTDPYLKDHVFKGTHLFPTVFGIEAMAQAVSAVTGVNNLDYLCLENVLLSYPIAVERDAATEIHIRALIEDTSVKGDEIRVKAGIAVDQTGFSKNHFEATFVLHVQKNVDQYTGKIPETFLDIKPGEDLYGHMLFQGGLFQRIQAIRSLNDTQCVFDSAIEITGHSSNALRGELVAGDPFFRDTLLQSVQIIITDNILLPIEIDKWEIFFRNREQSSHTVVTKIVQRGNDIVNAGVIAINVNKQVIERLQGYKTKTVENVQNPFRIDDLKGPDDWDESRINSRIQYYCGKLSKRPPVISLRHQSGIHDMGTTQRHIVESALLEKAYGKLKASDINFPDDISIAWTTEGKPFTNNKSAVKVSISHDSRLFLCAVGTAEQGCDVEAITHRNDEEWRELLGAIRVPLLKTVAHIDTSLDRAGTRIWCAVETLRKATDMEEDNLRYEQRIEDCLVFKGSGFSILTFPVTLLRGRERMFAIALAEEYHDREVFKTGDRGGPVEQAKWGTLIPGGPQGQKVFSYQFPLGLRDSATRGGGVHFASYFHWLGKVRELTLTPISQYIADAFFNGQFMVTNYTESDITRHVKNHEIIDARAWIHKMHGFKDSSLILHFEWNKLMGSGKTTPVAFSRHQVSWVKVKGHGVVEPMACPGVFMDFLQKNDMLPKEDRTASGGAVPSHEVISISRLGNIYYEGELLDESTILSESVFDTSMEHSNLAQNIYFSNYVTWQGHLRDRFLYTISPEQYNKMNNHGQFACVRAQVKHLREAMPFDRISVTIKLKRLYECGIDMYFEYFRVDSDGDRVKLAHGDHTVAWVSIDNADEYVPQKLPAIYFTTLLNRVHEKYGSPR